MMTTPLNEISTPLTLAQLRRKDVQDAIRLRIGIDAKRVFPCAKEGEVPPVEEPSGSPWVVFDNGEKFAKKFSALSPPLVVVDTRMCVGPGKPYEDDYTKGKHKMTLCSIASAFREAGFKRSVEKLEADALEFMRILFDLRVKIAKEAFDHNMGAWIMYKKMAGEAALADNDEAMALEKDARNKALWERALQQYLTDAILYQKWDDKKKKTVPRDRGDFAKFGEGRADTVECRRSVWSKVSYVRKGEMEATKTRIHQGFKSEREIIDATDRGAIEDEKLRDAFGRTLQMSQGFLEHQKIFYSPADIIDGKTGEPLISYGEHTHSWDQRVLHDGDIVQVEVCFKPAQQKEARNLHIYHMQMRIVVLHRNDSALEDVFSAEYKKRFETTEEKKAPEIDYSVPPEMRSHEHWVKPQLDPDLFENGDEDEERPSKKKRTEG